MSILTTSCLAVKSMESFVFFEGAGICVCHLPQPCYRIVKGAGQDACCSHHMLSDNPLWRHWVINSIHSALDLLGCLGFMYSSFGSCYVTASLPTHLEWSKTLLATYHYGEKRLILLTAQDLIAYIRSLNHS